MEDTEKRPETQEDHEHHTAAVRGAVFHVCGGEYQ